LHFTSYSDRICWSFSDHSRLSSSRRRRQKRLSAALARRRASWQSASNRGVVFLRLRRTVMNGQCWSSSLVSTSRYSWTRSSTNWSCSTSMSAHSLVAARSDAKASRDRRRHFLHVSHEGIQCYAVNRCKCVTAAGTEVTIQSVSLQQVANWSSEQCWALLSTTANSVYISGFVHTLQCTGTVGWASGWASGL